MFKHIIIDARFWRKSAAGLSTYSQHLIKGLAEIDQKNQYTVLITPEDVAEFDVSAPNFTAAVTKIGHYSLAEQTKLPKLLNDLKPDLVHFLHFNHPLRYRGKFVVTLHDLTVVYFPVGRQQKNPLRRWAFMTTMRNAVKRANRVIAVSQTTKNDIIRDLNGDPNRIKVIYEGINAPQLSKFSAFSGRHREFSCVLTPEVKEKMRRSNLEKLDINGPYLLFISQWRPHKRIEDLVAAFEKIAPIFPKLKLVLVGKPNPLFPQIIRRVEHSPVRHQIITPGFVDDDIIPTLYANAEIFVFPSAYEGFGFPPLEAMSYGTPVISSDASCLPEILGDAAEFYPVGDIDLLAQTITNLLKNKSRRVELSKLGQLHAAKYSWQKTAQETLDVYKNIL